jgi:hypothetical protein
MLLKFGNASEQLREAVAKQKTSKSHCPLGRHKSIEIKRLIALDKCPAVRPIGIGNVLDQLCAKIMIDITGDCVQQECQADQLGLGIKSGIEGSIHVFSDFFEEYAIQGWGLLLVDAANAFNALSRQALWTA